MDFYSAGLLTKSLRVDMLLHSDTLYQFYGIGTRSGQSKDYEIVICWFLAKHAALRSKSKDWLARNRYNVSEWQI
jgi:hypothetical protein